ncbi:MAG: hypothetical protein H7332_02565 [Bdellovibrionales bacterium]|nr:hypothetical protein [Ramlibacter sp.]
MQSLVTVAHQLLKSRWLPHAAARRFRNSGPHSAWQSILTTVRDSMEPDRSPMWLLRKEMVEVVADCSDDVRNRMTRSIYRAGDAFDLWLLRSDLFHHVAQNKGQQEAKRRINGLLAFFANWLPKKQLIPL